MDWQAISSIALILTLGAVIWYARETRGLKIQMIKQIELNLRPFLIIFYKPYQGMEYFYIKNIGHGCALDIKINDLAILDTQEIQIKYVIIPINLLDSKEEEKLELRNQSERTLSVFEWGPLLPRTAVRSFDFLISYKNIENKEYKTFGKLGKCGVIIEGTK